MVGRRRGTDNSWHCGCGFATCFECLAVSENDLDGFRSIQRQVVCPCPRLDIVDLGVPRVDVCSRNNEISSANLHILFPEVTAFRSLALAIYAAGPIPDPWMMLAVMYFSVDT
jgi:hypothetical protein